MFGFWSCKRELIFWIVKTFGQNGHVCFICVAAVIVNGGDTGASQRIRISWKSSTFFVSKAIWENGCQVAAAWWPNIEIRSWYVRLSLCHIWCFYQKMPNSQLCRPSGHDNCSVENVSRDVVDFCNCSPLGLMMLLPYSSFRRCIFSLFRLLSTPLALLIDSIQTFLIEFTCVSKCYIYDCIVVKCKKGCSILITVFWILLDD